MVTKSKKSTTNKKKKVRVLNLNKETVRELNRARRNESREVITTVAVVVHCKAQF